MNCPDQIDLKKNLMTNPIIATIVIAFLTASASLGYMMYLHTIQIDAITAKHDKALICKHSENVEVLAAMETAKATYAQDKKELYSDNSKLVNRINILEFRIERYLAERETNTETINALEKQINQNAKIKVPKSTLAEVVPLKLENSRLRTEITEMQSKSLTQQTELNEKIDMLYSEIDRLKIEHEKQHEIKIVVTTTDKSSGILRVIFFDDIDQTKPTIDNYNANILDEFSFVCDKKNVRNIFRKVKDLSFSKASFARIVNTGSNAWKGNITFYLNQKKIFYFPAKEDPKSVQSDDSWDYKL